MSLWTTIRDLDKKFSWSFFGFLLAAIFGALTVYLGFIRDSSPNILFDVTTNTEVLDIKEPLPQLIVTYDGIDIRQQDLALHVIEIKIVNDSGTDILKTFYDGNDPLGIAVNTGKIIRADVIDASNDYLKKHAECTVVSELETRFSEVLLDAEQSFVVKLLVIHPSATIPTVTPLGHVAGIKSVHLTESYKLPLQPSYFVRVLQGSWQVQILRTVAYFFLFILALAVGITPVVIIGWFVEKQKRQKAVRDFKLRDGDIRKQEEYLLTVFLEDGPGRLIRLYHMLNDKRKLTDFCVRHRKIAVLTSSEQRLFFFGNSLLRVDTLLSVGLVHEIDGAFIGDPKALTFFKSFVDFLKERGLLGPYQGIIFEGSFGPRTVVAVEDKESVDTNITND